MAENIPKYAKPPVIEIVLGVSFAPLASWQVPHFGLFWQQIRSDYADFTVQPPLPDELGIPGAPRGNQLTINLGFPVPRCWFINNEEGWLIQVQNSRFISNWRKKPDRDYPNYSTFEERFSRDWERFCEFLRTEKLEEPQLAQAEVSYINHIESSSVESVAEMLPALSGLTKQEFLPLPIGFVLNTVYSIGENKGQLHIVGQRVLRHEDMKEVIQLTVTAKTAIASNTREGIVNALQLGHEWVVRGFTDFTSPAMHTLWERTQ